MMSCPFVAFGIVCGKAGLQAWGGPHIAGDVSSVRCAWYLGPLDQG